MGLFAFFGLWETTLLAGAGAISVPIIIHLLNRRRFKVVTWAAMRFLLAAQKQNTRRMRIEQLILLLVRTALVALIVFAMASVMPWAENVWAMIWPEGAGGQAQRGGRTHHVLVLDGSLSMNLMTDGKSLFDRARQMAMTKVSDAPAGDAFSVLLMKDSPAWIVGEVSHDARKVGREIEQLQAGHGNASLPAALNMVAAKLAEASSRFPVQNVYFFTDMQKSTWLEGAVDESRAQATETSDAKPKAAYLDMAQRASTIFVDLGRDENKNLAVTSLRLDDALVTTGTPTKVWASIKNFGRELRPGTRIELLAGRAREAVADSPFAMRTVGSKTILDEIRPGETRTIDFDYVFTAPGAYALQVKLEGDDLEPDDARSVVVTVKDTVSVLLVGGKAASDPFERATEYLRLALNPFRPGAEPKFAPLRPKVISAAQFVDVSEAELAGYDCIYLCDVPQFGLGELRRLEGHLRRGGGVVFALGERAAENLETYNRLLFKNETGILPAKLFKKVQAPADHHFTLNAQDDQYLEPPLHAFRDDDDRLSLRTGRFRQYIQAKVGADPKIRTVLTFMPALDALTSATFDKTLANDHPALVEWNPPLPGEHGEPRAKEASQRRPQLRYRGKVLLFTSTLNMDWNSWPGSPSYGALMQEITRLAASGRLREQSSLVGQAIEEVIPAAGADVDATLHFPTPGLKPRLVRAPLVEDMAAFRFADTDQSGIYKVTVGGDPREYLFAVNVPTSRPDQGGSESDLTRAEPVEIKKAFPGWDFQVVDDPRQANYGGAAIENNNAETERAAVGPILAHWALVLALLLIFAEIVLAWQFGHYSSVEGIAAQSATGRVWPVATAAIGGIVFLLGAFILLHAARTGDFLGFLPDEVRGWAERGLGVPPAPAGESTRWDLEHQRWLPGPANEAWISGLLAIAAIVLIFFTYRAEGPHVRPTYKVLLGALRVFLVLVTLAVLLPQLQLRFDRQGWPDIVVLIDDSLSMGQPDASQDEKAREKINKLAETIKRKLAEQLPQKIKALEAELDAKGRMDGKNIELDPTSSLLTARLQALQAELAALDSAAWHPTRLQLAQALLAQPERNWLHVLLNQRRSKVHIYHLDAEGRAVRLTDAGGSAGEITDHADPRLLERAESAVTGLEPEARDSRLGTALRQIIDQYRGAALSAVIMFTDGVTTKDETIQQAGEYAAQKAVPLFFVGLGDDQEMNDLKLHDLLVNDTPFVGDYIVFEARLSGKGLKDLTVPVVLKFKDSSGKEKELAREPVKIDPSGKESKVRLRHQPKDAGRKVYVVEVEAPESERDGKSSPNLRLERAIDVMEAKLTKVLYIEGQPRYEYRFVKSLLERESPDAKKNKSVELKVLLLDADADFAKTDKTALTDFPAGPAELEQYDVVIIGDADPRHPLLGKARLQMLADFVRGEDAKGKKTGKSGTGLLMLAGPQFAPHAYKDTPLASVLPIDPLGKPPADLADRQRPFRMELTPIGRIHPMFRFDSSENTNLSILRNLAPMYWWSSGYRLRPLAEVLAVHPTEKALGREAGQDARHPLIVQQFVGSGRSLFIGVDEIWRWRFREDEARFNNFWQQTTRYLSRSRISKTDLRLDRQTPYRSGEPIRVTVRFPESMSAGGGQIKSGPVSNVKVTVEYRPKAAPGGPVASPEVGTLSLAKVEGSFGTFEGQFDRTREGRYRFRLTTPDVSKQQPDGEKPHAEATVELPPGELDRLRMNQQEMTQAAEATQGRFYTLANAESLLDDLPSGFRVSLSAPRPPLLLWNHWLMFLLVLGIVTSEWILRKRKHLL